MEKLAIDKENQLSEAFDLLTIVQVARALGMDLRTGTAQKSPLRNDRHPGSFSVQEKFFKDHAHDEHKGGVWKFVELACPSWEKKEIADFLIRTAGMAPQSKPPGRVRREARESRAKLYAAAEAKARELPNIPEAPPLWSEDVRGRWAEGLKPLKEALEKTAATRGWPPEALDALAGSKTSFPRVPWVDEGRRRMWAWRVERPLFAAKEARLIPVGYHSRYKVFRQGEVAGRRWCYIPYAPACPKSEFQRRLAASPVQLPTYPFILGDIGSPPHLAIIVEGQFDAVSMALAFGWLPRGLPPGVVILGLRGVQSQAPLLAAYGAWFRRHRPFVWILGDNDAAGRELARLAASGRIDASPSLAARLRAQGCRVRIQFTAVDGCKDFNDVWRKHRPSIQQMEALAEAIGARTTNRLRDQTEYLAN